MSYKLNRQDENPYWRKYIDSVSANKSTYWLKEVIIETPFPSTSYAPYTEEEFIELLESSISFRYNWGDRSEFENLKFKCKKDFMTGGLLQKPIDNCSSDISFGTVNYHKDEIYEGRYYDGGVMCPTNAYDIMSKDGYACLFTIPKLETTYHCVDEYFELVK